MSNKSRAGQDFEKAVFEFFRQQDPQARVLFDHKVPDRDTGRPRQADVWVTYRFGGVCEMSLLVSCKDHSRPLDVGEIESFMSEIRSTRAHAGVLYSRSGFTDGAIEKARCNSISCCRLFRGTPPERPSELLVGAYIGRPQFLMHTKPLGKDAPAEIKWGSILNEFVHSGETRARVRDLLLSTFFQMLERRTASSGSPEDLLGTLPINVKSRCPPFEVKIVLVWEWYHGTFDAFRLTGVHNATEPGKFVGDILMGPVPFESAPESPAWRKVLGPPTKDSGICITMTALACPTPVVLDRVLRRCRVFRRQPWVLRCDNGPQLQAPDAPPANGVGLTISIGKPDSRH